MTTFLQFDFTSGLRNRNDGGDATSSSSFTDFWHQHQIALVFVATVLGLTAIFGLLLLLCKLVERSRSSARGATGSDGGRSKKHEVVRLVASPRDEEEQVENMEVVRQSHVTIAEMLRRWSEKFSGILSSSRRSETRNPHQQPDTKEQELVVFSISTQP